MKQCYTFLWLWSIFYGILAFFPFFFEGFFPDVLMISFIISYSTYTLPYLYDWNIILLITCQETNPSYISTYNEITFFCVQYSAASASVAESKILPWPFLTTIAWNPCILDNSFNCQWYIGVIYYRFFRVHGSFKILGIWLAILKQWWKSK